MKFHCQESDTEVFFDGAVGVVCKCFNSFVIRIISVLKLDNLANLVTRKLKLLITVIDQNGVQSEVLPVLVITLDFIDFKTFSFNPKLKLG